ncbi:respiratory burst oxidase homolog protein E isoform X2 [Citrus clementina]|uniref:respiratory burst oxidase homolog protein E isoform X2 n=1 Tax=Citrus clementina TaxID=85681 RepID=UPI000CECE5EE|nr:respiratory burst oxidase homolog protein E isoform X2 [Citrus x clementina]
MRSLSRSSSRSNYGRTFELPDDCEDPQSRRTSDYAVGGAMLPIFLNDLSRNSQQEQAQDLVELTIELEDDAVVLCSVSTPTAPARVSRSSHGSRRKFGWLRSGSSSDIEERTISARDERRIKAKLQRARSGAKRALNGLRFISKTAGASDAEELWRLVESRFESLAEDGLLAREDFGECIGMVDTKEFAVGIFDALARRRGQKIGKITKEELREFWLQISDQSFDARLQIFFDMADSNVDGRITREEVQELWQLETLLLQRDTYMNYSRPLSTTSKTSNWSQNLSPFTPKGAFRKLSFTFRCLVLENWQRGWILLLWMMAMAGLFAWKFIQYKNMAAFQVMGYCLTTAKGAAETLKLNMALILLPVCRNTLTWLRSTRARYFVPFDDNINFHKTIACAIIIGVVLHVGNHLACDFPRLVNSSPEEFAPMSTQFHNKKPTYKYLLTGVEGVTGIVMVVLMAIAFTLATHKFRKNGVRLPSPFNRLTGFNAFWYSHHLTAIVYILLIVHGNFLYLAHEWYQKTTWMYISAPLLLYVAERNLRTRRSGHFSAKDLKVAVLPGNVLSIVMSKPNGFRYRSGQYIFLHCPTISSFEWHPFSITSAPGDDHLSVHIRIVGDWTHELKRVFTEDKDSACVIGRAEFGQVGTNNRIQPRLLVDGPYGAAAQDYSNYDVLLLVGLGIGATPFISILRDLLNNTREELMDSNTDSSRSASLNSCTSSNTSPGSSMIAGGKKKPQRTRNAYFYWVTREPGSFEWFKGVMDQVAEMDLKGQIELHNYLTSVYEEGDARSTLITMVQALNHAKHGVDILSGTRVRTHFARPNWKEVFSRVATKHPNATIGVFYCGMPVLAKELKKLSHELTHRTSTRFEFHKEYF